MPLNVRRKRVSLFLAILTIAFAFLVFLDSPETVKVQHADPVLVSGVPSVLYSTNKPLVANHTLVGNVTVPNVSIAESPVMFTLVVLSSAQYAAWSTSTPYQEFPRVYSYSSGKNVNYYGNTSEIVFPIKLTINSTDIYYFLGYQAPSQLFGAGGRTSLKFSLREVYMTSTTQTILNVPSTIFDAAAIISGVLFGLSVAPAVKRRGLQRCSASFREISSLSNLGSCRNALIVFSYALESCSTCGLPICSNLTP